MYVLFFYLAFVINKKDKNKNKTFQKKAHHSRIISVDVGNGNIGFVNGARETLLFRFFFFDDDEGDINNGPSI